jgi:hypothetical protein
MQFVRGNIMGAIAKFSEKHRIPYPIRESKLYLQATSEGIKALKEIGQGGIRESYMYYAVTIASKRNLCS